MVLRLESIKNTEKGGQLVFQTGEDTTITVNCDINELMRIENLLKQFIITKNKGN